MQGYYTFMLHAHLPYVRHYEADRLEERWLYEAITECYIPLLWELKENSAFKNWTISFSPPLMEMLTDPVIQRRYLEYLDQTEDLISKEVKREKAGSLQKVTRFYSDRYQKIRATFEEWEQNILAGFKYFYENGQIECMTTAATHAFLPYLQTEQGVRAQIVHGIDCFAKHFGRRPRGFWLPECAFSPGIDRILFEEGIHYTFVDEQAIHTAEPNPSKSIVEPIYSPHGIVLFPRHQQLSQKIWSSYTGYPGDHDYREFYRDIGYERELDYIQPYIHPEGIRIDTGLKYHRITGMTEEKDVYNREWAETKIKAHCKDFHQAIKQELLSSQEKGLEHSLICTPFDAELFGHWWFEGPEWVSFLFESKNENDYEFITPTDYIDRHYQVLDTAHVSFTTWGRDGYGDVWLNERNAWMYRHLHNAEKELIRCQTKFKEPSILQKRAMHQMIREWMLGASSDWAFIMEQASATEYAINRFKDHIGRFDKIKEQLVTNSLTTEFMNEMEREYPFLKDIKDELFISAHDAYVSKRETTKTQNGLKILMLSWEYPPMVVGGLARHVYDLSKELVSLGHEVYVLTSHVEGYPAYEINQGVHVYRVKSLQPNANDFFHWIGSLNLAIADQGRELAKQIKFDCIHAHDWLVSVAAKGLKHALQLPLVATIHATEHGRNNGIHTPVQFEIHQKEWELTYEANKVIVCSEYMRDEVIGVFKLPNEKVHVLPNGVDPSMLKVYGETESWKQSFGDQHDFYIFSIGRIVKEKGFQTIIDAAPRILERHPHVKFIIAGKGPMLHEFQEKVKERGLSSTIFFVGFVDDEKRNLFLQDCDAALFPSLYEPFGIVALEGMASGKPVIVSDTGGLGDIIKHEVNGLTIYPGNPESLADQVNALVENQEFRTKIATYGKREAETTYCWHNIALDTAKLLEQTIKQPELLRG